MLQTFCDLNGVEYHQDVVKLEKKEFSGKEVSFFRVKNCKKEYSIYVNRNIAQRVNEDGYLGFPLLNAKFVVKETGTVLVVPEDGTIAMVVSAHSGYRGAVYSFEIESVEDKDHNPLSYDRVYEFMEYHSPSGALGESQYVFINIPVKTKYIKVKADTSGRRITRGVKFIHYTIDNGHCRREVVDDDLDDIVNDLV